MHLRVSDETVVTVTQTIIFLAGSTVPQVVTLTHHNMGNASLSLEAVSAEGNYYGARLENAAAVVAMQGFQVYRRVQGLKEDVMGELVPENQKAFIVQPQPSSHLAKASFLLLADLAADADTSITVLSSDPAVISTTGQTVTVKKGTRGPALISVKHGGTAGSAFVSFRVDSAAGKYAGVESGNVQVVAMPLLLFSAVRVDIQTDGVGEFTVRPGTAPSQDVSIQCISSDPAVATVTPAILFTAAGGTSDDNAKTVTLFYRKQGAVTVSFFASDSEGSNFEGLVWCGPSLLSVLTLVLQLSFACCDSGYGSISSPRLLACTLSSPPQPPSPHCTGPTAW